MTIFKSKNDFVSAISGFLVQNEETYLPRITRETCISVFAWFRWMAGVAVKSFFTKACIQKLLVKLTPGWFNFTSLAYRVWTKKLDNFTSEKLYFYIFKTVKLFFEKLGMWNWNLLVLHSSFHKLCSCRRKFSFLNVWHFELKKQKIVC